MVPPEEIEVEQPATLPADFSEWDSGDTTETQPSIPATARVFVSPVEDRAPHSASRASAAAFFSVSSNTAFVRNQRVE